MPQTRRKPANDPPASERADEPSAVPPADPVSEPAAMPPEDDRRGGTARLLRLGAVLVVAAAIVVASFVGWPILYSRYIAPIGANTADLDEVRDRLAAVEARQDELAAERATLDERIGGVDGRVGGLEDALDEHTRRLAELDAMDVTLASGQSAGTAEAAREVSILRAMELMSRARLFLYESNFGLAEEDLVAARDVLAALDEGTASTSQETIQVAIERLDRTIDSLPELPVVASDDLDIAWQALLGHTPPPVTAASPSSTEQPSPTASP